MPFIFRHRPLLMSDPKPTKEALIIRLAGEGMSQRAICAQLGVGQHRVFNALKIFQHDAHYP
jgi:transposase